MQLADISHAFQHSCVKRMLEAGVTGRIGLVTCLWRHWTSQSCSINRNKIVCDGDTELAPCLWTSTALEWQFHVDCSVSSFTNLFSRQPCPSKPLSQRLILRPNGAVFKIIQCFLKRLFIHRTRQSSQSRQNFVTNRNNAIFRRRSPTLPCLLSVKIANVDITTYEYNTDLFVGVTYVMKTEDTHTYLTVTVYGAIGLKITVHYTL